MTSSANATFSCPMCQEIYSNIQLLFHIPKCYVDTCKKLNCQPQCFCSGSLKRTHSNRSSLTPGSSNNSLLQSLLPPPQTDSSDPNSSLLTPSLQMGSSGPTIDQLTGKVCVLCGNKRSPSQVPLSIVRVGNHRIIKVCKKAHIRILEERELLQKIIETELEKIKNSDHVVNESELDASDDEQKHTHTNHNNENGGTMQKCCGYSQSHPTALPCSELIENPILKAVTANGVMRYFCKASHLIRFFLVEECGKMPNETPRTKKAKLSTDSNQSFQHIEQDQLQQENIDQPKYQIQ